MCKQSSRKLQLWEFQWVDVKLETRRRGRKNKRKRKREEGVVGVLLNLVEALDVRGCKGSLLLGSGCTVTIS